MAEYLGRCPLCGGEKQPGSTTFAVDLAFGVVVVRGVPALVCITCGETWLENPVAAQLEVVTAEARHSRAVVEVRQWQPAAA